MKRHEPGSPLRGSVTVPGDKSISHRALILGALADGTSKISNLPDGADVRATIACLVRFGVGISTHAEGLVEVEGSIPREPRDVLDAGNSGTTARLLMGIAAGVAGCSSFTGDDTLRRRPMGRVTEPLTAMGARVLGRGGGELLPLTIAGGRLRGAAHISGAPSAQVKGALLLAGLGADGSTSVTEPLPSRDHTERMLRALGVPVEAHGSTVSVTGGSTPEPFALTVPGDVSSAMYLVAAAVLVEGSDLVVEGVGLNPGRTAALDVLRRMGAAVTWEITGERCGEPFGWIQAQHGPLSGTDVDPAEVPALIDEIPILSIVASQAAGRTRIRGAAELRVKESDRIATIGAGLRALGGAVEERADGLVIEGPVRLSGGEVSARGDHRIAMAFWVAELVAAGAVRVHGGSAVRTSFPRFLDVLARARER